MKTAALREQIQRAHEHEQATGQLTQQLAQQLPGLHPSIRFDGGDPKAALAHFVSAYIGQVPDLLDAAAEVAAEAGIERHIKPVLKIAEDYFFKPPRIMDNHEGLDCLLDEAYLAHRLVEEVNDLYIRHFSQPLIPLDTTVANLIAHQLIGETFANQLDEVVHHSVDNLVDEDSFELESAQAYKEKLTAPETGAAWKRWPCLSRQLGIGLSAG